MLQGRGIASKRHVLREHIQLQAQRHVRRVKRGIIVRVLVIGLSVMPVMLVQEQETANKPLVLREHIQPRDQRHVRRVKRGIIVREIVIG